MSETKQEIRFPVKSHYPVRLIQTDFSGNFPPTVFGITRAVLQWSPVCQSSANDYRSFPVCYDTQIEETADLRKVYITALVHPEMAQALVEAEMHWTPDVIREELAAYLNHYRPLAIAFEVRVLVQLPADGGI